MSSFAVKRDQSFNSYIEASFARQIYRAESHENICEVKLRISQRIYSLVMAILKGASSIFIGNNFLIQSKEAWAQWIKGNRFEKISQTSKELNQSAPAEKSRFENSVFLEGAKIQNIFLSFFSTKEARAIRAVNNTLKTAVTNHTWTSASTDITLFSAWRASFPRANRTTLSRRTKLTEADFVNLRAIGHLTLASNPHISDNAFSYLTDMRLLQIRFCDQITDIAFAPLTNLRVLDIANCDGITNTAFEHFTNIRQLSLKLCNQITSAAFNHLPNLVVLHLFSCDQITDEAFANLIKLRKLSIASMPITDEAFVNLQNIVKLVIMDCPQVTDNAFSRLKHLQRLSVTLCDQVTVSSVEDVRHLFPE